MTSGLDWPVSVSWEPSISDYVVHLRAAGRSPGTIRLHRHYLRHFAGYSPTPRSMTIEALEAAVAVPHWSPETRKSASSVARSFFTWAARTGRVPVNVAAPLPVVKVPPGVPRPAPAAVVEVGEVAADPRVVLMVLLGAYAGLRAGEISRVHSTDWDGDGLTVHGKGGRVRWVPVVHPGLRDALDVADGWVFPGQVDGHLAPGTVTKLVAAALPAGWTAHTLRHRFGTEAHNGTGDLFAVMRLLGHSKPETTLRYVRTGQGALRAAVRAAA